MKQMFDQLIGLIIKAFVAVLYSCSQFRLKRKVYTTRRERIIDLIIGLIAFPVINGLNLLFLMIIANWLPDFVENEAGAQCMMSGAWIINSAIFILALIFRPYLGLGYALGFIIASMLPILAGIFVVAGCFAIIIAVIIFAAIAAAMEELSQNYLLLIFLFALCLGALTLTGAVIFLIFWRWVK